MIVTLSNGDRRHIRPGGNLNGIRIVGFETDSVDYYAQLGNPMRFEEWLRDVIYTRMIKGSICGLK